MDLPFSELQQRFFTALAGQFQAIFQQSKQGQDTHEARLRTQGFIQAGELCGLCQRAQVQQLMEQLHQHVFGQTVTERQDHQQQQQQAQQRWHEARQAGDFSFFDEPALYRQPAEPRTNTDPSA